MLLVTKTFSSQQRTIDYLDVEKLASAGRWCVKLLQCIGNNVNVVTKPVIWCNYYWAHTAISQFNCIIDFKGNILVSGQNLFLPHTKHVLVDWCSFGT